MNQETEFRSCRIGRLDRVWRIAWATNFRFPEDFCEISELLLDLFEYAFSAGTPVSPEFRLLDTAF